MMKDLKKIRLRLLKETDLETRVEWMNNPSIYSSMHFDIPVTLSKTKDWFRNKASNRADYAFIDTDERVVAMGGITDIINNKGELYIFVGPHLHGQGIGKVSTYILCEHAFRELDLSAIYLYTNISNMKAQTIYEHIGFRNLSDVKASEDFLFDSNNRLYYELTLADMKL